MKQPQLKIISHLLRPTRGGAAGVVIVFAVLLSIAAKGGLMGQVAVAGEKFKFSPRDES